MRRYYCQSDLLAGVGVRDESDRSSLWPIWCLCLAGCPLPSRPALRQTPVSPSRLCRRRVEEHLDLLPCIRWRPSHFSGGFSSIALLLPTNNAMRPRSTTRGARLSCGCTLDQLLRRDAVPWLDRRASRTNRSSGCRGGSPDAPCRSFLDPTLLRAA